MADMVDKKLFEQLAEKEVEDVVMVPVCEYSDDEECYTVTAWGNRFAVYPEKKMARVLDDIAEPHDYFYIFLINYLLSEKKREPSGEWISEKDLTGGTTFFRGPHKIPTELIVDTFGDDTDSLAQKCETLGGIPLDMADLSYSFKVVGSIRIALLYWRGDEDFEAEAKLLIDSSVADALRLDVVFGLLCDACVRIAH